MSAWYSKRPPTRGGFFRTRHTCGAEAELIETLARAAGDWWDMSMPQLADALVQALPVPPSREELLDRVRDGLEAACRTPALRRRSTFRYLLENAKPRWQNPFGRRP